MSKEFPKEFKNLVPREPLTGLFTGKPNGLYESDRDWMESNADVLVPLMEAWFEEVERQKQMDEAWLKHWKKEKENKK